MPLVVELVGQEPSAVAADTALVPVADALSAETDDVPAADGTRTDDVFAVVAPAVVVSRYIVDNSAIVDCDVSVNDRRIGEGDRKILGSVAAIV